MCWYNNSNCAIVMIIFIIPAVKCLALRARSVLQDRHYATLIMDSNPYSGPLQMREAENPETVKSLSKVS